MESKEWRMVEELYGMLDDLETEDQKRFIQDLHDNLDPYSPFLDQMEGLAGGENQSKWLYTLYEYFCDENEDAFEDWDE